MQGHSDEISSVQVVSNERAITSSLDGYLREWNLISGECVKIFKGHSKSIFCSQLLMNKFLF